MFESNGSRFWQSIPPVTKNLIIINLAIWLIEVILPEFADNTLLRLLGLHYVGSDSFNPAQVVTYMFLHDPRNPMHVLFNMFTLWMFGRILEQVWGSRRYFYFYMICGVGAAVVQECVWALTWQSDYIAGIARLNGMTVDHMREYVDIAVSQGNPDFISAMNAFKGSILTVGASGAIFGLLLGFAFVFPDMPMYIFFIPIPIKAKYMVLGYGVLELLLGVNGAVSSVAHFAHLGGMIFGLAILLYWRHKGTLRGL